MRYMLALLCLVAALLAACGDGKDNESKDAKDKTPASAATEVATKAAPATKEAQETPKASPTPGAAAEDIFGDLQSYRYVMDLSAGEDLQFKIKGSFQAPDRTMMEVYLGDSDTPLGSYLRIRDQAWQKTLGFGGWEEITLAEAEESVEGLSPDDFWSDFPRGELVAISDDLGKEKVNGVDAQHYQIEKADAESLLKLAGLFGDEESGDIPESFAMELWLAEDGNWPVKASIAMTFPPGGEFTEATVVWEVTDVDSPDISIEPPQ